MRTDKAHAMKCPYISGNCSAEKCMAWIVKADSENEGVCMRLRVDALHGDVLTIALNTTQPDPNDMRSRIVKI